MKIKLIISFLIPLISIGQFQEKKTYDISRTSDPPNIDGVLDDKTWDKLNIANNFIQIEPNNGVQERYHQRT